MGQADGMADGPGAWLGPAERMALDHRGGHTRRMAENSRFPFSWPISPESIARETAGFERDLARTEAAQGPDARPVLAARSTLARAYRCVGRYQDAIALQQENLQESRRVLGPDHPDTLAAAAASAATLLVAWRLPDALAALGISSADLDRVVGADHPDATFNNAAGGRCLPRSFTCPIPSPAASQLMPNWRKIRCQTG